MRNERDRNDDYYAKKSKKPEHYYQEYQPSKQQQQQQANPGSKSEKARYERSFENRQSRQGSEPRAASGNNNFNNQESMRSGNFVSSERNRDTRSSEPGAGNHYEHRNKPPSGQQRIGNSAFNRLPLNIDSLPPRLKKKYLLEAGLSEELADKPIMEQSYSNTLPSGRGRNNRYDQQGYHYQNSYSKYNNQNQGYQHEHDSNHHHRSLTPPPSKPNRPQQQQQQPQQQQQKRYDWKPNEIQRRDETSPANTKTTIDDQNFDWSEDVLNSQSLPHEVNSSPNVQGKYDDSSRHRRRRRNRR